MNIFEKLFKCRAVRLFVFVVITYGGFHLWFAGAFIVGGAFYL